MDIKSFIEIGGFIVVIGGLILNYGHQKGRSETMEENINTKIDQHIADNEKSEGKLSADIDDIWKWKNKHEEDAANMREKYQVQLSEVKGAQMVGLEQFRQVLVILNEIKERLTRLETSK